MRILIADDSIVSRHLLDATLRKWGYDVLIASDGLEAYNALKDKDAPRIAILDWMMPGMTGPEVCKRVRAGSPGSDGAYTYLLLLSSKSQREDLIEGLESGADDYLTKPFDQHELKVRLRAGTRIIDLQRDLMEAREALREQATKDFLTNLWNRSSILDILQKELVRGGREKRPVGVVLADLDRFKNVNDSYGHFAGDALLREFSRRMLLSMRAYDSIGRYGGEEFLIILPGCDEHCSGSQAERMRAALANEPMVIGDASLTVTGSFGATSWRPGMPVHAENLIRTADNALYLAKNQGRNRVAVLPAA
ncbi:MAG TPA: diguanylate cyclase [Bryobacteraceae bacterium]|jgi:diguanylate cyclase (GGDEF)-like protein